MFSIAVDLTALNQAADRFQEIATAIQDEVVNQVIRIQGVWVAAVQGENLPGMTRRVRDEEYAASITDPRSMEYPFNGNAFSGRVISTRPDIAWRVEDGYSAFDMKPGLLQGPKAKRGKNGPYATVPFVHTGPDTVGAKGQPMPADIHHMYQTASRAGRPLNLPRHPTLMPITIDYGRRSKLPLMVNWNRPFGSPIMSGPYTWKTSPYEGMIKVGRARHKSAMTFRRVSAKSDPNSWIHPGMAPNPVMQAVRDSVEPGVREAILRRVQEVLSR